MHSKLATSGSTIIATTFMIAMMAGILITTELLLHLHYRWANDHWLFQRQRNFDVGYARPVSDRREYALAANYQDDETSINELGFRGKVVTQVSSHSLVCLIGDSVIYGSGVKTNETISAYLEQILKERGFNVVVLNGGVPSYNLRQSLDRWRLDIKPTWSCDVLVLNAANDVSLYQHYRKDWTVDTTWASQRFGIVAPSWSSIARYTSAIFSKFTRQKDVESIKLFSQLLNVELNDNVSYPLNDDIPVVLMPVNPCYYLRDDKEELSEEACSGYKGYANIKDEWQDTIALVNQVLKNVSNAENVYYLDTISYFDDVIGRSGKFVDFIHFSKFGARDVAVLLANKLVDWELIMD